MRFGTAAWALQDCRQLISQLPEDRSREAVNELLLRVRLR